MDFLEIIRTESGRFATLARQLDLTAAVPRCGDWTGADLVYHLAEVQDSWAQVAAGAQGEDIVQLERPSSDVDLPAAYEAASGRLVEALEGREPTQPCWSWHDDGHSIGWVLRRQAHEALIHRVDAEQTAGVPVTEPPAEVARDGVDEVLSVMVDGAPEWGTVTLDGDAVRLEVTDAGPPASWTLRLGRFRGTGPESGKDWDLSAALLTDDDVPDAAVVRAPAWDLDLWLWGRGDLPAGAVSDGDASVVERFRGTVAEATQ